MRAIEYTGDAIRIIDQTALPSREVYRTLRTTASLAEAIRRLRVRGAPALGIAGAYGVALAAVRSRATTGAGVMRDAEKAGAILSATRPTAVNLGWAIERTLAAGREHASSDADKVRRVLEEEARSIAVEDEAACSEMARLGQRFVAKTATVLTHCNTGFLCTGGVGTALGVIRIAHETGKNVTVIATETRPLLQGARLTAWELGRFGIPHSVVTDGAAAALISRGEVDVVIVGADRIAANGDVANKIGTYGLALAARAAKIPFIVVAPTSTIDRDVSDGSTIEIEERPADEVTTILGRLRVAPPYARARNPAFDVTPARLITAVVTERGVAEPPSRESIASLFGKSRRAGRRRLQRRS